MHLGGGGVKPFIHFHCVLHEKRGSGVKKTCKIAYVINGRPPRVLANSNIKRHLKLTNT